MNPGTTPTRGAIYLRLSREDEREPGNTEEKFASHLSRCRDIADRYGVPVAEEDIFQDRASGLHLTGRPEFRRLLDLLEARHLTHVIAINQDRLTRGDPIQATQVANAFLASQATLLTEMGEPMVFTDERYGADKEFLFLLQSLTGQLTARKSNELRIGADRKRTENNRRSRAVAPYGYDLIRPPTDITGRQVEPTAQDVENGLAAQVEGRFQWLQLVPDPAEYPVLEEIFRRFRQGESVSAITKDLNARQIPPPGLKRFGRGQRWRNQSLQSILRNPVHAGRLSHRWRVQRMVAQKKRVLRLPAHQQIVAKEAGPWVHVLEGLADYHGIQATFDNRMKEKVPRNGLMSGLLFCPYGGRYTKGGARLYRCDCDGGRYANTEHRHTGYGIGVHKADRWGRAIVEACILALPDELLAARPRRAKQSDRAKLQQHLNQAQAAQREAENRRDEIIFSYTRQVEVFGQRAVDAAAVKARDAVERAEKEVRRLSEEAQQPDIPAAAPTLLGLRNALREGADMWQNPYAVQRKWVELFIRRIDLHAIEPGKRFYAGGTVTLWPIWEQFGITIPPLELQDWEERRRRSRERKKGSQ